ncbi:hypothetical protein BJX99DRAFT_258224 [Aspergillus californicus]
MFRRDERRRGQSNANRSLFERVSAPRPEQPDSNQSLLQQVSAPNPTSRPGQDQRVRMSPYERAVYNLRRKEDGIEAICRQACAYTGSTIVWVRAIDHRTTQVTSAPGRRGQRRVIYEPSDPHITVYMGRSDEYDYEGHLYCAYSRSAPSVPTRLAEPRERRLPVGGCNPDLTNSRTRQQVVFRHR